MSVSKESTPQDWERPHVYTVIGFVMTSQSRVDTGSMELGFTPTEEGNSVEGS